MEKVLAPAPPTMEVEVASPVAEGVVSTTNQGSRSFCTSTLEPACVSTQVGIKLGISAIQHQGVTPAAAAVELVIPPKVMESAPPAVSVALESP